VAEYIKLALVLAASYCMGSIPTGFWIGRAFYKKDIRTIGSGNIGATNTLRALGTVPGVIALLIDMVKGAGAVYLAGRVAGQTTGISSVDPLIFVVTIKIVAGIVAIAGHNWSLFLKFKGGKGVATSCGVFLTLAPVPTLIALAVFILVLAATRFVSVASMTASLVLPPMIFWLCPPEERLILGIISVCMALLIVIRHRSNLVRLMKGEEPRLGRKVDNP